MHKLTRLAIDAFCVADFAAIGRASHGEQVDLVGIAQTAWPFWVGAAAGWAICQLGRERTLLGEGLMVWLSAVVLGHLIRIVLGPGTQVPFVIVSLIALALFFLGWRGLVGLIGRIRGGSGGDPA